MPGCQGDAFNDLRSPGCWVYDVTTELLVVGCISSPSLCPDSDSLLYSNQFKNIQKKRALWKMVSSSNAPYSWYVINRPRHAKPPVCSINTAELGILSSFGRFGDKLSFSLVLLLSLLLLLQLLPLLLLLQLQCSFLTKNKSQHLNQCICTHPRLAYMLIKHMFKLTDIGDTFSLVVFSWSIIISFLIFTSLLW